MFRGAIIIAFLLGATACSERCYDCVLVSSDNDNTVLAKSRKICSEDEVRMLEQSTPQHATWKCSK